jgi:hypothetical protein
MTVMDAAWNPGDFLVPEETTAMWVDRGDSQIVPYGRERHDV